MRTGRYHANLYHAERDPIAYILSANVHRRHLSKGQQAMAYPEATEKGGRGKTAVSNTGVSGEYVTKARFVLRHAPDLADKVMAGSSLPEAYTLAADQKREARSMNGPGMKSETVWILSLVSVRD